MKSIVNATNRLADFANETPTIAVGLAVCSAIATRSPNANRRFWRRKWLSRLIGLCVVGDKIYGASNGDSGAILLLPNGHFEELTGKQAKNPPIGSGAAGPVPFTPSLISPWKLLVMSDGVWKYVGWDRVREIARAQRGKALIDGLLNAAKLVRTGNSRTISPWC